MRRLWLTILLLITALVLAACGGGGQGETALPTSAAVTNEPEPTEEEEEPTAEPTEEEEEPTPEEEEPTAEPDDSDDGVATLPVDMDNLETYSYPTGLFEIDIPASWEAEDRSSESEVLVRFADENNNGVVLVNVFELEGEQSEEELTTILTDYLDNTYGEQEGFSQDPPSTQSDGSILVVWGYDAETTEGAARLLGNSFIEQRESLVSVLTIALPNAQFGDLEQPINDLLNSYSLDSSIAPEPADAAAAEATAGPDDSGGTSNPNLQEVEIGTVEAYEFPTGLFTIDIPEGWTVNDTSADDRATLVWTDAAQNALIAVNVFEQEEQLSDEQLTELLNQFVEAGFGSQPDFQADEPKPQEDGSILVVWTYTATLSDSSTATLLGNSFIQQNDNKVSVLTTAVPQQQFDALVEPLNDIINSYEVDPSAPIS